MFAGDDVQGYGISRGLKSPLENITACFWVNVPALYASGREPTIVSYATSDDSANELVIYFLESALYVHRRSDIRIGYVIKYRILPCIL